MSFFKIYFKIILKHANIYKPTKHNTKYSNEYFLTHILDVLGTVVNYKSLMKLQSIKSNHEYHYKTINKKHIEWSQNGVYENAYKEILQINNSCKITTNNYIDTTLIVNKCGVEGIGYGCGESRKKKYTSIAVVCNENIKPISILCSSNYTKKLNEITTIKTLPHDTKSILPSIKKINTDKPYNLIGDAGFVYNKSLLPSNVNLIYATRSNQHKKNTPDDKLKLKNRYKIENLFAKIKQFNRIHIRRDKNIAPFMGFIHLAIIKII